LAFGDPAKVGHERPAALVAAAASGRARHAAMWVARGCPCPIAGRSLRPSRPPLSRRRLRFGIHACAGRLRRLLGHGQPLTVSSHEHPDRSTVLEQDHRHRGIPRGVARAEGAGLAGKRSQDGEAQPAWS